MANEFLDQNGLKQVWNRALELFSPKKHSHKIEDTTDLQSTLDSKAALSHTHDDYVTKEEGKELFTSEEREKLSKIEDNAQVNKIESISLNNVPQSISNKNVNLNIDLSPYAEKSELEETNENLSDLEREVADWYSKRFDYSKLTDEEKAQIKQDVTTINAQFSKVYNVSGEQSVFPIDIERYAYGLDILEVYINGMRLVEGVDYSNDGQRITLTKPLNVIGQLEIVVFKSVSANVADWDSFKGEKGEAGNSLRIVANTNILRYKSNNVPYDESAELTLEGTVDTSGAKWNIEGCGEITGDSVTISSEHFERNWIAGSTSSTSRMRCICQAGDYVLIGGVSGALIASTDNGNTWTTLTKFASNAITGIAYNNGIFVAVDGDGKIYSTTNPEGTWNLVFESGKIFNAVQSDGSIFVAVGETYPGTTGIISKSTDGINWTTVNTECPNFYAICHDGRAFFAIGAGGVAWSSEDGSMWKETGATGFDCRGITYNSGRYIAGGAAGQIAYSYNGENWYNGTVNRTSTVAVSHIRAISSAYGEYYSVCYLSNGYGEIWKSNNGIDWTVCYEPLGSNTRIWAIDFIGSGILASGDNGKTYFLEIPRCIEISVTCEDLSDKVSVYILQDASKGDRGIQGETGSTGNGISSIAVSESTADGGNNVVTINMTDGTFKTFNVKNGSKGADGSSGGGSSDVSLKLIAGSENATGSGGYDTNSDSDINAFIETGIVKWAKYRNISGLPNGDGMVQSIGWRSPVDGAGWGRQIAYDDESHNIYSRYMGNGSWSGWTKVLVDGDSAPASDVYSWAKASSKPSYSASEVGAVPTSRTVNGKALSGNISLSASDLGATKLSYTTSITRNSWSKVTLPSCNVGEIKLVKASLSSVGDGEYVGFYTPSGGTYVIFKMGYHTTFGGYGNHSATTHDSMYFSGGAKFYEYGCESDETIDTVTVLFGRIS